MNTAGPPHKGMITINEAARRCRVSRRTIVNWIEREYITSTKAANGHNVWLEPAEVAQFDKDRRALGYDRLGRPKDADRVDPALALRARDRQTSPGA